MCRRSNFMLSILALSLHFSFVIEISVVRRWQRIICFVLVLFCFLLSEFHGNIPWLWHKSFLARIQIGSQCFGLKSNLAFSWKIWGATKRARRERKRNRGTTESRTKMSLPIFGLWYREHMHTHLKNKKWCRYYSSVHKTLSKRSEKSQSRLSATAEFIAYSIPYPHTCIATVYIQPMGLDVHQS